MEAAGGAGAAVQGCHGQGDGQHGQHDEVPRHHHLAQKTVIHIAYQEHTAQPQYHAQRLLLDVVEAVAHAQVTGGVAGAEQHHQPKDHNNGKPLRCWVKKHKMSPETVFLCSFALSAVGYVLALALLRWC